MEFDMIGVDASLAHAFRRILLAEVFCFLLLLLLLLQIHNDGELIVSEIIRLQFNHSRCQRWPSSKCSSTTTPLSFRTRCWLIVSVSFRSKPTRHASSTRAIVSDYLHIFTIYIHIQASRVNSYTCLAFEKSER